MAERLPRELVGKLSGAGGVQLLTVGEYVILQVGGMGVRLSPDRQDEFGRLWIAACQQAEAAGLTGEQASRG